MRPKNIHTQKYTHTKIYTHKNIHTQKFISPYRSDDLCLFFCLYPSSMVPRRHIHNYTYAGKRRKIPAHLINTVLLICHNALESLVPYTLPTIEK